MAAQEMMWNLYEAEMAAAITPCTSNNVRSYVTSDLPVSVVIPVKNEEANLGRCLAGLTRFTEVVVVDSGSTDGTRTIATESNVSLVDFSWDGRFPKKRNWILMNYPLANPWVLFLDADEIVDDRFCDELSDCIRIGSCDGYWINFTNYFLGQPLNHGDPQRKLALFRVGSGLYERIDEFEWSGLDMEIHEHPIIRGKVGEIRTKIDHRDGQGVAKFIARHREYALWEYRRWSALRAAPPESWELLTPRQKRKYRHLDKWWFAWAYFLWTYVARRGFLDGQAGFAIAFYKLWYFWTIWLLIREQSRSVPA